MDLKDFFDNDDPIIAEAAQLLSEAKAGLDQGLLTQEQFDELAEDALQIAEIDELADNLERKIAVQKAVGIFKTILGVVTK